MPAGNDGNSIGKIIYDAIRATGVTASGFIRNFKGGCYDGQLVKIHVSSVFVCVYCVYCKMYMSVLCVHCTV